MKTGDHVMSLGDSYMSKGSFGIVVHVENAHAPLIRWYDIKDNKNRPGIKLYHKISDLKLISEASIDPNIAFLQKKGR